MLTVMCADCHVCWLSFMLTVIYADCHLCWLSFMLTVIFYAYCHFLCRLSFMLNVICADCWLSFMLTVIILIDMALILKLIDSEKDLNKLYWHKQVFIALAKFVIVLLYFLYLPFQSRACTLKLDLTRVDLLTGHHSNGRLLALPANIKLGWKWLAVPNTTAC